MDLVNFLASRHSVRSYFDEPVCESDRSIINDLIKKLNEKYRVNFVVHYDHPQAFKGLLGRIMFKGASNIVIFYCKDATEAGYASVPLLLKMHQLGLSTCYVGATYKKRLFEVPGATIQCALAFGRGENTGVPHKNKNITEFYDAKLKDDKNLDNILKILLTAPSAMNRQGVKLIKVNGQYDLIKTIVTPFSDFDLGIYRYYLALALKKETL